MPVIIYQPEGAEPERYEFNWRKFSMDEVGELEDHFDKNWDEIRELYLRGRRNVIGRILFILMRRQEPALAWETLNLEASDADVDFTLEEWLELLPARLAQDDLKPEERKALLAVKKQKEAEAKAKSVGQSEDPKE